MTQFNTTSYDVERPSGRCAVTGRELLPGEPYMATLVELDETSSQDNRRDPNTASAAAIGLKRMDVCWEAWQDGGRPDGLFCYWKTTVAEPDKKRKLFVDNDVLLNLFRRLADEGQPQRIPFRFVVGLVLMRKKMLRYDGTTRRQVKDDQGNDQAQDWWQVTPKLDLSKGPLGKWNDADALEMLDPHLDEQQIQQVTEQLRDILEAEL